MKTYKIISFFNDKNKNCFTSQFSNNKKNSKIVNDKMIFFLIKFFWHNSKLMDFIIIIILTHILYIYCNKCVVASHW